jgi:hypothetical protein
LACAVVRRVGQAFLGPGDETAPGSGPVTGQPRGQRHDLVRQHTVPVTVELHPDEMDCTELGERAGQELAKAALVSQGGFVLRAFYRAFGRALPLAALLGTLVLAGCTRAPDPTTAFPDEPPTTATTAPATTGYVPAPAGGCPMVVVGCPRPDVTPGAVIPSTDGVCRPDYNKRRELTAAQKRRVLAAYYLPPTAHVAEWDHLVARWAGGESTPRNIWPEVDAAEKQRKDRLEVRLFDAVCRDKTMTLAAARERMRRFWANW